MDMNKLQEKYQKLLSYLKELDSVAIAFSGGVDSTFLLAAAKEALGDKVIALTAKSCLFPERESGEAEDFCKNLGVEQIVLDLGDTELPAFKHNPPNRCYICKKGLFEKFLQKAKEYQMSYVAEGSNMDDLGDYRPGLQAITELGIKSPLRAAELTKAEIRELSKQMGLPTWSKPSFACPFRIRRDHHRRKTFHGRASRGPSPQQWIPPIPRSHPRNHRQNRTFTRRHSKNVR